MSFQHQPPMKTSTPSGVPYIIACAYFGGLDNEHFGSVLALEYGDPRVLLIRTMGVPYIDQARAILAAGALQHLPADGVLMMLDHDIIFKPQDVIALVEACATSEYDILGVPYSMRGEGKSLIGFPVTPKDGSDLELDCYEAGGLYPADALGMGFTAIKMRVFHELKRHLPKILIGSRAVTWPFFALEVQEDAIDFEGERLAFYHGEDVSFCRLARKHGFKVGLDTRPRIAHKGSKLYMLEDTSFMVPMAKSFHMKLRGNPGGYEPGNPFVQSAPLAQKE